MAEGERSRSKLRTSIGRYQIQGSLGAGAMGAVYKGFDPLIKRTLAIKTIRLDIARGSDEYKSFLERFYQEARISGTLSHPSIVTLFDIGEDDGLPFLALEYIEGETVEAMLGRGVKFRPERVLGLVSQVADALDYAHSKGVIHRDIKPANLLVYGDDRVKVMDFGIAKLADSEMTKVGQLLGTPSYMSPEQAMGERKLDGRSDIFSLGVCAFEMLCGQQPFPGNNVTAILYKLVHVPPIEPDNLEMNGLIPEKWHEVFGKVLAKRREDRYQTAAEFVRDLEFCLGTWFSGLGDELLPTESVPLPTIPGAPPPQSGGDEPAIVVSMDEIEPVTPPEPFVPQRPAGPAIPDYDDTPMTLAMEKGDSLPPTVMVERPPVPAPAVEEDDLPPTVAVVRPNAPAPPEDDEDLPETIAVPRKPVEKTVRFDAPAPATPAKGSSGKLPTYKPPVRHGTRPVLPPRPGTLRSTPGRAPAATPEPMAPISQPPQLAGGSKRLLIGGLLAVVVVAAAIAYFATRPGPARGGPSQPPARPSGKGVIQVQTNPAGARVKLYDVATGNESPRLTGVPAGTYEVIAELPEYEPASQTVSLKEGDPPLEVRLELEPSKSAMGEADILSRPAGANVEVDGERIGQTPLRGHPLRVGRRRVRLTTEGYQPYAAFLTVEERKTARLDARLLGEGASPEPVASATPLPATPPPTPTPTPAPAGSPSPRRLPGVSARPSPAVAAATPAPPTPAPTEAPAARPSVDTSRVYEEKDVDTPPSKTSGDLYQPRLRSGETLSVTLEWIVTESGEVTDVKVVESGGKALDEAEAQAIAKWKYAPGLKRGVKVKVRMVRKYTFRAG